MYRKYWIIPTVLVLAALLAACGGSSKKSPTATPTTAPTATAAATKEATAAPTEAATTEATAAATKEATAAPTQATTGTTPEATTAAGAQSSTGQEVQVQMINTTFDPKEITIKAGTKVTWTNNDSVGHTVTAGTRGSPSGLFESGNVAPGQSFSFVFDTPGTYSYFCQYHASMDGTVIVQ
jgi:plastocyanin